METVLLRNTEFAEDTASPHLAQLFVRSQSVVARCVGGETLIVPVRGKVGDLASIYSFNPTGSLIWQSLESAKSLDEYYRLLSTHATSVDIWLTIYHHRLPLAVVEDFNEGNEEIQDSFPKLLYIRMLVG